MTSPPARGEGLRRLAQAAGLDLGERDRLRRELMAVEAQNVKLADELARLRQENRDLRDAAATWIGLYERQLSRANEAAAQLAERE